MWYYCPIASQSRNPISSNFNASSSGGASHPRLMSTKCIERSESPRLTWLNSYSLLHCKPQCLSRTSRSVRVQKSNIVNSQPASSSRGDLEQTRFVFIFWKIVWCYFRRLFVNKLLLTDEIYQCTACVSKWVYEDPALIILGSRVQMN